MVTEFIYVIHERGKEEIQYCLEEPVLVRLTHTHMQTQTI